MNNELVQLDDGGFEILDVYEHGVAQPRRMVDALATISAGTKDTKGIPSWNRNGLISLHDPEGRAPGLRAALEANGYKSLTIAFPFNDPNQFIQQRFAEYSASKLLAYGDQHSITVLDAAKNGRVVYLAGTEEYNTAVARCKVQVSVYFNLAAWEPEPHITFPDGALTMYRLRFTSRNSLQNLKATLDHIRKFTRGLIAGIPLDTQFVVREVAGADGSRRKVPVWVFTLKPPQTRTLTSANLQSILLSGLEVGRSLMLPAPAAETVETAIEDIPDVDLDDAEAEPSATDMARLETGFNPEEWRKKYFAIAEGTPYAEKHGRAWFIERYTHGATSSLSDVLRGCDAQAMQDMLDELSRIVERWRNGEQKIGELLKILFPSTATFIPDDVQAVMDRHAYTRKTFPDVDAMVDVYRELKALVDARRSTQTSATPLKFEELGGERK